MATIGFKLISGQPNIRILPEHTTAGSFTVGDLVQLTSGKVAICAADSAIFGVAAKAASGTVSTEIPVYVITPTQTWLAAADTTTATTHVGGKYGLNIGTAGSMSVDIGDTTTTSVRIDDLDPRDGAKALGRVYVKFDPDVLQNL